MILSNFKFILKRSNIPIPKTKIGMAKFLRLSSLVKTKHTIPLRILLISKLRDKSKKIFLRLGF